MKPIRRELLNGLFVLVLASLIHAAFEAFHVNFDLHLWALIVMGITMAVGGYVVFESLVSANEREESTRRREEEWLKRVGTPARLELSQENADAGMDAVIADVRAMSPGTDLTTMFYVSGDGGSPFVNRSDDPKRGEFYTAILEQLKRGTIREYKRIVCFDHDVLANDPELRSGVLRVGEGPGTIDRLSGNHCRLLMETKGCSLYIAPVVFRAIVGFYGVNKASISVETVDQAGGGRRFAGTMIFSDPPNGEIIEQFRQIERATERRMVAVHEIRFPEDAAPAADLAAR